MDFDRQERGKEVQSEWDFERKWTLAIEKTCGGPNGERFRVGLDFHMKRSSLEVQTA